LKVKKGLIVAILWLCAAPASAQWLRAIGGVGLGNYEMPEGGIVTERRNGMVIGGGLELGSGGVVGEIDVLYMQKKNYQVDRGWEFRLSELSLPVMVKVKLRQGIAPYVIGGWETAFILSQQTTGNAPSVSYSLDTARFDYGLVGGGGIHFPLGAVSAEFEVRYHYGLADTTKYLNDGGYQLKTRVIAILAAVRF
jgi:Outer membrane protein beta-barrel domain